MLFFIISWSCHRAQWIIHDHFLLKTVRKPPIYFKLICIQFSESYDLDPVHVLSKVFYYPKINRLCPFVCKLFRKNVKIKLKFIAVTSHNSPRSRKPILLLESRLKWLYELCVSNKSMKSDFIANTSLRTSCF